MACKKDITPTKSNLKIGNILYNFLNHSTTYEFQYSDNNLLDKIQVSGCFRFDQCYIGQAKAFTTQYIDNKWILNNNFGMSGGWLDDNDQTLYLDNKGKIINSQFKDGDYLGLPFSTGTKYFKYLNGVLLLTYNKMGSNNVNDTCYFSFNSDRLVSFTNSLRSRYQTNQILDSTSNYVLGYQNTTPDTSVIKVNGINNLILCIPFEVQETLPFLVVDDRLSLTGKKQNYLINSITVEEKRNNITQKTTTYTINYLYDLEGRITHVQWINNATLANYREAVIGYL